jgi:hypothetical protein
LTKVKNLLTIFNNVEIKHHGTENDLEIQNDVNLDNSNSLELNIDDNIGGGVCTSSDINVHNISVGTSSSSNNPLDDGDFDECYRNNEKDKINETDFILHDTPIDCLF